MASRKLFRAPSEAALERFRQDPESPDYWESRSSKYKTYFILNRETGNIKIGRTTGVSTRIRTLRTACGDTLELLLLLDSDIEQQLHELFWYQRIWANAEWFKYDDAIRDYIKTMQIFQKYKNNKRINGDS